MSTHFVAIPSVIVVVLCHLSEPAVSMQLPLRPEVFGNVGWMKAAGDEGGLGSGLLVGGGAVVPIGERLGMDVDVSTVGTQLNSTPSEAFQLRRTFVAPSIVRRWGSNQTYAFAGAGIGLENSRRVSRSSNVLPGFRPPNSQEVSPGLFEFRSTDTGASLVLRAGIVREISHGALIRFDMLWSQRLVLPNIGLRIGLGFRF